MGSMEPPRAEANGGPAVPACNGGGPPANGGDLPYGKRVKAGSGAVGLPLEVGTRVMCRWRDQKLHPVKVIERRKVQSSASPDYEYYVHYTEFNRRLDEWVKLEQLDLDSVEADIDEKVEDKATSLKMTRHQKRKIDETHVEAMRNLMLPVYGNMRNSLK